MRLTPSTSDPENKLKAPHTNINMKRLAPPSTGPTKVARRTPTCTLVEVIACDLLWPYLSSSDKHQLCLVNRKISQCTKLHIIRISKWPWLHKLSPMELTRTLCLDPPHNGQSRAYILAQDYFLRCKVGPQVISRTDVRTFIRFTDTWNDGLGSLDRFGQSFIMKDVNLSNLLHYARLLLTLKFPTMDRLRDEMRHETNNLRDQEWAVYCSTKRCNLDTVPWLSLNYHVGEIIDRLPNLPLDILRSRVSNNAKCYLRYQASTSQKWRSDVIARMKDMLSAGEHVHSLPLILQAIVTYGSLNDIEELSGPCVRPYWSHPVYMTACLRDDYMWALERMIMAGVKWAKLTPCLCALGRIDALAVGYSLGEIQADELIDHDVYECVIKTADAVQAPVCTQSIDWLSADGVFACLDDADKYSLIFVNKKASKIAQEHFVTVSRWPWLHELSIKALNQLLAGYLYDDHTRSMVFAADYLLRKRIGKWIYQKMHIGTLTHYTSSYEDGKRIADQLDDKPHKNSIWRISAMVMSELRLCLAMKFSRVDAMVDILRRDEVYRGVITQCASWCLLRGYNPREKPWRELGYEFQHACNLLRDLRWTSITYDVSIAEYKSFIGYAIQCGRIDDLVRLVKARQTFGRKCRLRGSINAEIVKYGHFDDVRTIYDTTSDTYGEPRLSQMTVSALCARPDGNPIVGWLLEKRRPGLTAKIIQALCASGNVTMLAVMHIRGEVNDRRLLDYGDIGSRIKKEADRMMTYCDGLFAV